VTVTAQTVLNLKYMLEIFSWLDTLGKLDERCQALQESYVKARESLIKAMRENALNKEGFFNGYFNDNGKWLLSEKDPDGESRVYLVSNAWAIISGVADEEMRTRVLENINQHSFGRMGYNTGSCEFKEQIPNAGRVGNGSFSIASPYNHAQSFLVRASCVAGDWETAYKATRYILPIEQAYAPVEKTFAPPYAIANSYSNSDANLHRVELQFLSGTVSYVLRNVYSYFFGITYGFNGLTIQHCMPEVFGDCLAEFEYLGKKFRLAFKKVDKAEKTVMFNGKVWTKTAESAETRRTHPFFADADMLEENSIEIEY
jgi:N,N'-diacetylchitobiose phosphorylase